LRAEGVDVRLGHKAKEFRVDEERRKVLICEHEGRDLAIGFDALLVAVGRVANTAGYGLEELGIPLTRAHDRDERVPADRLPQHLRLRRRRRALPVHPYRLAPGLVRGGERALRRQLWKKRVDYSVIPWATFTDPEVARVGLNETEAKERNIPYEVTVYGLDDLDRAIADEEAHGMVKVLTVPGKDRILGATIAGEHAGDLIAEFVPP
jgi:pyruvate/2-oxoglutarate dehydrogenase complex dihydrolipoamide dehydrogenase (E3) component